MSIATELQALQQDITNARSKIVEKGGTVTTGGGSSQLATDIDTIPAGGGNLKDISPITENGTYKVFDDLIIVDSLKGNGTAYFPTDIVIPNSTSLDSRYEIELCLIIGGTNSGYVYGCKGTGSYTYNFYGYDGGSGGIQIINGYYDFYPSYTRTVGTETTYITNGAKLYINGAQKNYQGTSKYFTNPTPLYIFAYNNGSTPTNIFHDSSFKYLKIKNISGKLLYHFVPCRTSDNTPKILEKVSMNVYDATGDTTGMTLGADIEDLRYDGFQSPIQVNVSSKKYNITMDEMIGDPDSSGVLQQPIGGQGEIVFTGVKQIPSYGLYYKFYNQKGLKSVSFPDLERITGTSMSYCFSASSSANSGTIKQLSMPKLKTIDSSAMNYCFRYQDLSETELNLPALTSVAGYSFYYVFANTNLKGLYADALTSLTSGSYSFGYVCSNNKNYDFEYHFNSLNRITSANSFMYAFENSYAYYEKIAHPFPELESVDGNTAFGYSNTSNYLVRFVFDKLKTVGTITSTSNNIFAGTFGRGYWTFESGHTDDYDRIGVFFPALQTVGYNNSNNKQHFANICNNPSRNRATLHFYDLTTVISGYTGTTQGMFQTTGAKRVYMPKLSSVTNGSTMFYNDSTLEEIHFGKENQATIEAMTGYNTKFGATNSTIYFDMINHITVNGVVYDRDGAKCDLDNWYFAWTNNGNTIYTTNFKDPAVGDTVYTKSGDTYTAVGTITAIS